jgi:hypothetical protein
VGITRATGVRCPWCARPVADGPDRPELCPSCGVPLAPADVAPSRGMARAVPAARARRSQRLRAVAALLGLASAFLAVTGVALAVTLLGSDHGDGAAQANLIKVLRAAEDVKRQTGTFAGAQPVVLAGNVFGIKVLDSFRPSTAPAEVSMTVVGDGWYGAVRSNSTRCFAAATLGGDPQMLQSVLNGNCTGDAARAALTPLDSASAGSSAASAAGTAP